MQIACAFLRCEVVEKGADAAPDAVDGAFVSLTEQDFELCEDLLDRVEVGAIGGRKTSRAPAARMALRIAWPLWEQRLSMTTMSPGWSVGTSICST